MQGATQTVEHDNGIDNEELHVRNNANSQRTRDATQTCYLCQDESPVVMGLCVITEEIVTAAGLKKRKIQEDIVACTADLDTAKKELLHAQDRVIAIKDKFNEMQRHHHRAQKNYNFAADLSKAVSIQLHAAVSTETATESLKNVRCLKNICEAVLKSTTLEMERVTKKTSLLGDNLKSARKRVEERVGVYEDLLHRRDRASKAQQEELRLMDVVTEFMRKESRWANLPRQ